MYPESKMIQYLESEEGKKAVEEYFERQRKIEEIAKSQYKRFHEKFSSRFFEIVEKIQAKYNTEAYVEKWYSRGIEPPEHLYWFLFEYAKQYGREATIAEHIQYGNDFTAEMFFVHGYLFNLMNGQGSVIKIHKTAS